MSDGSRSNSDGVDRRGFVGGGLATLAALAGGDLAGFASTPADAAAPLPGADLSDAYEARLAAAAAMRRRGTPAHRPNGDEERLPHWAAGYSKALPHDRLGRVDSAAYRTLRRALGSGKNEDFERIPLGGYRNLANPQAAYSFELVGPAPEQIACPPAPRFDSGEQAAEIVEVLWQALLRDVPFAEYGGHPLVEAACADLSRCPGFAGPTGSRGVDPTTLFRGTTAGDRRGPYLSQFLLQPVPYRPITFEQRFQTAAPGRDYLVGYEEWLDCRNGGVVPASRLVDPPRHIATGRDLAEYVHQDFSYQAYLSAALMLLRWAAPVDGANPYKHSHTQGALATFGEPFALSLLANATQLAFKAAWFQKWLVHRRLRPEAYAGCVHHHLRGALRFPIHADLLHSAVLQQLPAAAPRRGASRSWLLPMAYPEGSPAHPSYPSGHATIAGTCVTLLKALFDENFEIPDPVEASPDGAVLHPYSGTTLSVGDELNKLASNIALGRDFGGVHFRSDAAAGMAMGEEIAVRLLEESRYVTPGVAPTYTFTSFDGRRVEVS